MGHQETHELQSKLGPQLPLVAGLFLVLFAIANTWLIYEHSDRVRWVEHTFQVEGAVSGLQIIAFSTESSLRAYLLTGDDRERSSIVAAGPAFKTRRNELQQLVKDNPDQLETLAAAGQAGQQRLALLQRAMALKAARADEAALKLATDPAGLQSLRSFREATSAMRQHEAILLQRRSQQAARSQTALLVASGLAGLMTAIFTLVWMNNAVRSNRALREAYAELSASNALLTSEMQSRATAEGQIRQMQKMEAIGQLTGGIAHDFNNMLGVIIGNLDLMERKLAQGQTDVQRFAASALEGAERAAALTARLLAFSRQQPLAPQPIEVNRLVFNLSDVLRRTLGEAVQIETVQGGGLWRTYADPVQLESALINLAVNARDAMDGEGKLTIETANTYLDDAYANNISAGQYVMIALTDTGSGMPPEVIERAFDPFFTTKATGKGTGLGLSQVHGFIRQTHGHVKIYSEPGQGTTIKIYLPRLFGDGELTREEMRPRPADLFGRPGEIVMVVEDEDRVRQFAVEALCELGYTVIHADNAQNALAMLKDQPRISLLLTDIVMPGCNGRVLAESAVQLIPNLPVLYMTGFTRNAVVHNGLLDPGVNFLAKPFTVDQLGSKVREVLDMAT